MKAEYLIKQVRESTQQLWDLHQLFISSEGKQGLKCFTPEDLEKKYNRTDEEILEEAETKGIYIVDKDEYLKRKKEKTI